MDSRGQGLTLETIVIAALVVIVLVVLVLVFSGNIGIFSSSVSDCQARSGECKPICAANEATMGSTSCSKESKVCCIPIT